MKRGVMIALALGVVLGFASSSIASRMVGLYPRQWLRLVPAAQELYVAGILDEIGTERLFDAMSNHREIFRSAKCIENKGVNAQQIAQGMAEYAKLNPSAFESSNLPPTPYLSGSLHEYLEFLCPDLFNEAAYKRDQEVQEEFGKAGLDHPGMLRRD